MNKSRRKLERAFKLIKRDKTDEALKIVRPIVEAEPENVHAWWLLAYSATEPREVREALVKVLRLDPEYENAPKARDMLEKLNIEYPPESDEIARFPELGTSFPDAFSGEDLFGDETFAEGMPFETTAESEAPFADDAFGDVFGAADFDETGEDLFAMEDPFADLRGDIEAVPESIPEAPEMIEPEQKVAREIVFDDEPEYLDPETLADREEKAFRRRGRRGRMIRFAFLLVLGGGCLVAVLLAITLGGETGTDDPGMLKAINIESDVVANAVSSAESDLTLTNLGDENQVMVAKSSQGNTLFVEICSHPNRDLPRLIVQGMDIAAEQAMSLLGQLDAVGVSVDICNADQHDVLYRATSSVDNAIRYANGEIELSEFQALWTTS